MGEYFFLKEKENRSSKLFEKLSDEDNNTDAHLVVFAAAGGSGSGGVTVINDTIGDSDSLLINMMVLPYMEVSASRQKWNVGRCIARIASIKKQTALLLFSNLSEDLEDQHAVNEYVRELIIRFSNFGYKGNVPKIGTDIDKMDLKAFFVGRPAFVGISSLEKSDPDPSMLEKWVDTALKPRRNHADKDGLSIEVVDGKEKNIFSSVSKVLVVVGVPRTFDKEAPVAQIIKDRISKKFGKSISEIDFEIFSYGSLNKLELTVFFRHRSYRKNYLLAHFLDYFFTWYEDEETEYDYLSKSVDEDVDDEYIFDVIDIVSSEIGDNEQEIQKYFGHKLSPIK